MRDVTCHAFRGGRCVASGPVAEVALALIGQDAGVLIFDDADGRPIDLDLSGGAEAVQARYSAKPAGRGRPRLGVVPREVTLLPRHWEWLAAQPGGASAALRKLVEAAQQADDGETDQRLARDAAYRVMSALAGDLPHFEEAARALYKDDTALLARLMAGWPQDIAAHVQRLREGVAA